MSGQIVILNGAPRSGKSSIAAAMQESLDGIWINFGVDAFMNAMPSRYHPGIGLRPGEEGHHVYALVPQLYGALYDAVAAMANNALNVVVDVGHHDHDILVDSARRLDGLQALFVGVHCPLDEIMRRRLATWGPDDRITEAEPIPEPVQRWEKAVHGGWPYDLEFDTSMMSPEKCAAAIGERLPAGPSAAFAKLRGEARA